MILQTAVLSTTTLLTTTNHSADNIANSLRNVLSEWGVLEKVTSIVTDNAASMIKACELLQKRNLPCFAHSLTLIIQDALSQENTKPVIMKCKRIVGYFKSSTIAYEKFKEAQNDKQYSLLQETPTRWNTPQTLTADEIETLKDLVELFGPFHEATVQASASDSVTISLIIPLTCDLYHKLNDLQTNMKTTE
ncbi:zinc finger BED domain-containing protein 1-like, partial [Rhagoletis pomonella]|uniref:zinc finger BED domain-containing protein 1-like n=1 Tax=Rhagoletis pomonella TaxID=28610 RepID=UPI0017877688